MKELILRFVIGGISVCAFSLLGDLLRPKSFAGLFGAAPSVALATLGLTIAAEGSAYAALEARSMTAGSVAFFVYASCVSWLMMRYKLPALQTTGLLLTVWFGCAFGLWFLCLR